MKKAGIVVAALLCVALVCGGFYYLKNRPSGIDKEENLTEVQKIITRDLDQQYPPTPREVVKFYNRIIMSYYGEDYSDDEFEALVDQALRLFDDELAANNPKREYMAAIHKEVENYASRKRSITKANVCDSRDVLSLEDPDNGDDIAYVTVSYFVKEDNAYDKTYQQYVLRKSDTGEWKILTYYQIEANESEEEDD